MSDEGEIREINVNTFPPAIKYITASAAVDTYVIPRRKRRHGKSIQHQDNIKESWGRTAAVSSPTAPSSMLSPGDVSVDACFYSLGLELLCEPQISSATPGQVKGQSCVGQSGWRFRVSIIWKGQGSG